MPHFNHGLSKEEYNDRCIKIARLLDQGVDHNGLRERFGIERQMLSLMAAKGRKLIEGKTDAISNTSGRITARALSSQR